MKFEHEWFLRFSFAFVLIVGCKSLHINKRFRRDSNNAPALNFLPGNGTRVSDAPSPSFGDLWFRPANDEYNAYPPAPLTDNDVGDWRWSKGGGDPEGQTIYNINGVTWLCRQFRQLECYPVLDNIDEGSNGLGNHIPLRQVPTGPPATTPHHPKRTKPPKTTFCSRIIKFKAKDSAILKFNTFDGIIRVLLTSRREGNELMVMTKILKENDMGLDIVKNNPQIILDVTVDCDNINIIVDGVKYVKGYMFGRDGVRDLEIVGNLESTGMEPRAIEAPPQGRSRNDDKLLQRDAYHEVRIPEVNQDEFVDGGHRSVEGSSSHAEDISISDPNNSAHEAKVKDDNDGSEGLIDEQEDPNGDESGQDEGLDDNQDVAQGSNIDDLQVEGTGDVEVSLNDGKKNHVYQISRGPDDEVNVDIVYAPKSNVYDNKSLIIENKDYNYTLIVTENNFQIIHHDTKRNVTYEHGLQASGVQGVNVDGHVRNTQVKFKEEKEEPEVQNENEPINEPLVLTQEQTVSIYGNLCVDDCSQAAGGSYWCTVKAGDSEQCGPKPGHTPKGEECTSECRKLEDPYYWCNLRGQSQWQYCSPSLTYQEIPCENDSPRVMTMEPNDCSRYFICEAGNIKLEECPVGLHFIHESQACEWPNSDNPCDPASSEPSPSSRDDHPRSLLIGGSKNEVTEDPTKAGATTPSSASSAGGAKVDGHTKTIILNEASNGASHGLTSHGELCSNSCERRGYQYFWCKKPSSGLGQWSDSDFCSTHDGVTHYGEQCAEDSQCEKRGEQYFWCYKTDGSWGYCSPQKIYHEGSCATDGYYGLVGYCEHYVICTGGNPVVFSCLTGLFFDYTLLSCTTQDNAKCI